MPDISALEGMMGQGGMPDLSALGGALECLIWPNVWWWSQRKSRWIYDETGDEQDGQTNAKNKKNGNNRF